VIGFLSRRAASADSCLRPSSAYCAYLFDFQLIDVTADRRNVVAEFSLKAVAMNYDFIFVPGRTPLIIPVAR
jgi:hypothetical protein